MQAAMLHSKQLAKLLRVESVVVVADIYQQAFIGLQEFVAVSLYTHATVECKLSCIAPLFSLQYNNSLSSLVDGKRSRKKYGIRRY